MSENKYKYTHKHIRNIILTKNQIKLYINAKTDEVSLNKQLEKYNRYTHLKTPEIL